MKDQAETGGFERFHIRWVLVDSNADEAWERLSRREKGTVHPMIMTEHGLKVSRRSGDRLSDLGIYAGIVFHLYAIENVEFDPPRYRR